MEQPFDLVQTLGVSMAHQEWLTALNIRLPSFCCLSLCGNYALCFQVIQNLSQIDADIPKYWRTQCPLGFGNAPRNSGRITPSIEAVVKAVKTPEERDGSWPNLELAWIQEKLEGLLSQQEAGIRPAPKPAPNLQTVESGHRPIPQHTGNTTPALDDQRIKDIQKICTVNHYLKITHESFAVDTARATHGLMHETSNSKERHPHLCETSQLLSTHDDCHMVVPDIHQHSPNMNASGRVNSPSSDAQAKSNRLPSECAEIGGSDSQSGIQDLEIIEQDLGHGEDSACASPLEAEQDRYWTWDADAQQFRHWDEIRSKFIYCPKSFT